MDGIDKLLPVVLDIIRDIRRKEQGEIRNDELLPAVLLSVGQFSSSAWRCCDVSVGVNLVYNLLMTWIRNHSSWRV